MAVDEARHRPVFLRQWIHTSMCQRRQHGQSQFSSPNHQQGLDSYSLAFDVPGTLNDLRQILMVAPDGFAYNPHAAVDNKFSHEVDKSSDDVREAARAEFASLHAALERCGVQVPKHVRHCFTVRC